MTNTHTLIVDQLDENVKALFNELSDDWDISFEQWEKDYCEVFTKENKAVIYYSSEQLSNETMVHELLHIRLKKYNYSSTNHIWFLNQEHPFFKHVFTKELCNHIGNCMEHFKMFPTYHNMGYSPQKFIKNGGELQADLSNLSKIYLKINGKLSGQMVDLYIGNLISIYADPVKNNYQNHLEILKKKDVELFGIVTEFWDSWTKFDLEKQDVIFNNVTALYDKFMNDLETWYLKIN